VSLLIVVYLYYATFFLFLFCYLQTIIFLARFLNYLINHLPCYLLTAANSGPRNGLFSSGENSCATLTPSAIPSIPPYAVCMKPPPKLLPQPSRPPPRLPRPAVPMVSMAKPREQLVRLRNRRRIPNKVSSHFAK
jgi:hypothetical protein